MVVGGSFLTTPIGTEEILIREKLSEEHKQIFDSVVEFVEENIAPKSKELEKLNIELTVKLIREFSELGFGSIDIEEEYGGMEMDKISSMLVTEAIAHGRSASWAISFGAHVGIGTLPIAIFGNKEQKQKYLPKLATAEWIGAYCLTEPSSGSDALGAKTTATLSDDGKYYTLNGTKQFITNGGFADVFTVFAKINGEDFSCFIVERGFEGVSHGAEEVKMGLKGSSTTIVNLDNVKVPVENLLWKQGKGHQIAFNILNIGRIKLGIGNLGGCKAAINQALKYAKERKQFGQYISEFDMIKSKFADMVVMTYTLDSMAYNTVGKVHENIERIDKSDPNYQFKALESIEDYAIEASMLKVYGSEALGFMADTCIQILGGYGFTEEYPFAKMYRDTRVDRIFEGTNEINRQVIAGYYLKNTLMEKIPIREYVKIINAGLKSGQLPEIDCDILKEEKTTLEILKMAAIIVFNEAITVYGQGLKNEQMVLEDLANLFMCLYNLESVLLRITQKYEDKMDYKMDQVIGRLQTIETANQATGIIRRIIHGVGNKHDLPKLMEKYEKLRSYLTLSDNIYDLKRQITDYLYEKNQYPF
ncbi:MAG: acyl-CoA dehydrogenase family protein [Calditrichaeota bacterium]|nr:acyl-CoA dehydrogenase family protein [Calditrichota bacterium]